MERIFLFLEDPNILAQVQGTLAGDYQVVPGSDGVELAEPWDLAIVDPAALERLRDSLLSKKKVEEPVQFPVLLAARPEEWSRMAEEQKPALDEILLLPLEPWQLRLRVRNLLRSRRLSRELQGRLGELGAERSLLEAVFQSAPEAIVVTDDQGRVILTNPAANRLYGRPVPLGEYFLSRAALHLCRPDGTAWDPRDLPLTRAALDGETSRLVELAVVWPDGQRRDLMVNCAPIQDQQGRLNGAVGIFQDISEQKASDREKWNLFCQLQDYAEGARLENAELGTQAAELQAQAAELENQAVELETQAEELEVQNEELRVQKEELERLAADLRTEREYLKTVLEQMPAGLIIADAASGKILLGNRKAQEIWQRPITSLTEVMAFYRYPRFFADGRPYRAEEVPLSRALTRGEVVIDEEIVIIRADGSRAFLSVSAAPVRDPRGRIIAGVATYYDITEKKRAEREIARMASFPQLNPNPVMEMDFSGRITFHNEATGRVLKEFGLSEAADFLPPDLAKILIEARENPQISFYREMELGEAVFAQRFHVAAPFEVIRLYAIDITASKKAEEALIRAKEEWERTFDAVPDLITILDREHRVVRCNRAMAAALGREPEQLVGRPCFEVMHRSSGPPPFCPHSQLLADGQEHTTEVRELDHDFLVTASPLLDEAGVPLGSVHVARDITERKAAEQALRESRRDLNRAQAVAHIGSWRLDVGRNDLLWSDETYRIFGISPGTPLTYETFLAAVHREDREEVDRKWTAALGGEPYDIEHRIVVGDTVKWVREKAELELEAQGELLGGFGTVQDITARKQTEAELKKAYEGLELRVAERTVDLKATVEQLQEEVMERQRAEKQAKSLGRLYRLLSMVDEAIVRAPDQETLFMQVCRIAVEEGLFRLAWVGLKDRGGRALRAVAQYGVDEGYLESLVIPLKDVPQGRGPTGMAAREGRFDVCNDFASDPRMAPWREQALARGYRSSAAFPLRVAGKVMGTLTLYAERPGFFSDEEVALLESLSGDLSFAMESMDREARRRQAEEALVRHTALVHDLYNNAPCGYHSLDPEGTLVQINDTELAWLGYTREEVIGRLKFTDLLTPDSLDTFREKFPGFKERGWVRDLEFELRRKDGSLMPVLLNATAIRDEAGNFLMSRATLFDITERRRAEAALKESEEQLRFLATAMLSVQEKERGRLSRELHDGLGQALLVFKLQLRAIQRELPEECRELGKDCNFALQYMDEIIEDIRRLSHNLSPSVLEDIGLIPALNNLCHEFERLHDLKIRLEADELARPLGREAQIHLYRIFQEALTNISKHANASRVSLVIKQSGGAIDFAIEDNGAGFDPEEVQARGATEKGLGLAAMFERVRILGGELKIASRKGQGTRISFRVPGGE